MKTYFTDPEYRILLSALSREKNVCKKTDKQCGGGTKLQDMMQSIEKKVHRIQYGFNGIPEPEGISEPHPDGVKTLYDMTYSDFERMKRGL